MLVVIFIVLLELPQGHMFEKSPSTVSEGFILGLFLKHLLSASYVCEGFSHSRKLLINKELCLVLV